MLRDWKDNTHERTKAWLGTRPRLFFSIRKLIYGSKRFDQVVDPSSDIVIEGFPRSANSFAVGAFRSAQPCSVKIAHHLHSPAQILEAQRHNIPCLVLIRKPKDAIVSHKALQAQNRLRGNRGLKITFKTYRHMYINFYSPLLRGTQTYVVAPFDEVVTDYGKSIDRLNKAFETDFQVFNHTDTNVEMVLQKRGYHAGPNEKRQKFKAKFDEEYSILANGRLSRMTTQADIIYSNFLKSGLYPPG